MKRTNIIVLLVLGAILALLFNLGPDKTRDFQAKVYQLIAPLLSGGSGIAKQVTQVRSGLKSLEELERDNNSLKVENRELRATNQALRDVEQDINRLRRSLQFKERAIFKIVPAEIIARDASTWWHTATINRGKEDNIDSDMPVITDQGLVGKTTTVSQNIAVVLLVSDENCKVASSVEGTREQGIVQGERITTSVQPMLNLNFLSKQANLQPAQKVYTSGVGGVFPSGLLVGTVKDFRVRELDGQAQITPAVDLSQLQDVFVVTGTNRNANPPAVKAR